MFDRRKTLSTKAADAADLMIDFATLGEYGLEPVERRGKACERRSRLANQRSTGVWASAVSRFAVESS